MASDQRSRAEALTAALVANHLQSQQQHGAGSSSAWLTGRCMSMGYPLSQDPVPLARPFEDSIEVQVKAFTRQDVRDPEQTRPPSVLERVCEHLVYRVLGARDRREWDPLYVSKFEYITDRWREARKEWKQQCGDDPADVDESRLHWANKMLKVLIMRHAICTRNRADCLAFVEKKKGNAEQILDSCDLIRHYYRRFPMVCIQQANTVALLLLFTGLKMNVKVENRALWCPIELGPTGLPQLETRLLSVDLASVYCELAALHPVCAQLGPIKRVLHALHALYEGAWFHFLDVCRTSGEWTFFQRCLLSSSFAYARFRAIAEIATRPVKLVGDTLVDLIPTVRGFLTLREYTTRGLFASLRDAADFLFLIGIGCYVHRDPLDLNSELDPLTMASMRDPETLARALILLQDKAKVTIKDVVAAIEENRGKLAMPVDDGYFGLSQYRLDDVVVRIPRHLVPERATVPEQGEAVLSSSTSSSVGVDDARDPDYSPSTASSSSAKEEPDAEEGDDVSSSLPRSPESTGTDADEQPPYTASDDDAGNDDDRHPTDSQSVPPSEPSNVNETDADEPPNSRGGGTSTRSSRAQRKQPPLVEVQGRDVPVDHPYCPLDLTLIIDDDAVAEDRFAASVQCLVDTLSEGKEQALPAEAEMTLTLQHPESPPEIAVDEATDATLLHVHELLSRSPPLLEARDAYVEYYDTLHRTQRSELVTQEQHSRSEVAAEETRLFANLLESARNEQGRIRQAVLKQSVPDTSSWATTRADEWLPTRGQPGTAHQAPPVASRGLPSVVAAEEGRAALRYSVEAKEPFRGVPKSAPPVSFAGVPATLPISEVPVAPSRSLPDALPCAQPGAATVAASEVPAAPSTAGPRSLPDVLPLAQPGAATFAARRSVEPCDVVSQQKDTRHDDKTSAALATSAYYLGRKPPRSGTKRALPSTPAIEPFSRAFFSGLASQFVLWVISRRVDCQSIVHDEKEFSSLGGSAVVYAQLTMLILGDDDHVGIAHDVAAMLSAAPIGCSPQEGVLVSNARDITRHEAIALASAAGIVPMHVPEVLRVGLYPVSLSYTDVPRLAGADPSFNAAAGGIAIAVVDSGTGLDRLTSGLRLLLHSGGTSGAIDSVDSSSSLQLSFRVRGIVVVVDDVEDGPLYRRLEAAVELVITEAGGHQSISSNVNASSVFWTSYIASPRTQKSPSTALAFVPLRTIHNMGGDTRQAIADTVTAVVHRAYPATPVMRRPAVHPRELAQYNMYRSEADRGVSLLSEYEEDDVFTALPSRLLMAATR